MSPLRDASMSARAACLRRNVPPRPPDSNQRPSSKKRTSQTEVYGQSTSTSPEAGGKNPEKLRTTASMSPPPFPLRRGRGRICWSSRLQRGRTARPISAALGAATTRVGSEKGELMAMSNRVFRVVFARRNARRRDRPRFEPTPRCPGTGQRCHVRHAETSRQSCSTTASPVTDPAAQHHSASSRTRTSKAGQSASLPSLVAGYMPPWKPEPGHGDFADSGDYQTSKSSRSSGGSPRVHRSATSQRCRGRQR